MVSPPATSCTSRHANPASASAVRAACKPYSTKLRPHLPHGCMPTPRTATGFMAVPSSHRPPLPHDVLVVVVLEKSVDDQFHFRPHAQGLGIASHLPEDNHLLVAQFDRGDG